MADTHAVDTIERLDDWLVRRSRPDLQVWCHEGTAEPAVTVLEYGARVIWCWSPRSTMEQRDSTRAALMRAGWQALAAVSIGEVLPGEIELWTGEGYLVLLDAPAAVRHVATGIAWDRPAD